MKLTKLLGFIAMLTFASSSFADQTIEITGATAFRAGAVKAIVAMYKQGTGHLTDIAHTSTSTASNGHEGANDVIMRGTINNVNCPGITVIRCHWSGSVEGIRAVTTTVSEPYLTEAAFADVNGITYTGPADTNNKRQGATAFATGTVTDPEYAFSDVLPTSSPYPVSNVTTQTVGVLPFFCVVNDGADTAFTNMQSQKFGRLVTAGSKLASYFYPTSSTTKRVYMTGRNDGSGTRTSYLANSRDPKLDVGGDFRSVVNQYKNSTPSSDAIATLTRWPTNDGVNQSVVWDLTATGTTGNGGWSSGGTVAAALAAKTTSVSVDNGTAAALDLVSVIGLSDTVTAVTGGARVLSWNGQLVNVSLTSPFLVTAEREKFYNGSYTLWSNEQFMYNKTLSACENAVFNTIVSTIATQFGDAGIDAGLMTVGRADDGAFVQ